MKWLLLAFLILPACSTTVYRNGNPILRTYANADIVEFHQGDTSLRMVKMNHSTPTRAAGSVVGTALAGATGLAGAVITKGIIK